jgi:hypothetical protein
MPKYFEFEMSLRGIEPKIWRRILVRESLTFYDFHEAIQTACGWCDEHLFAFHAEPQTRREGRGEEIAGIPSEDDFPPWGHPTPEAKKIKLSSFFGMEKGRSKSCNYLYDFGDSWTHNIKLIREVELPEKFNVRLLDGARAFPPEDCGGVPGYYRCVEVFHGRIKDEEFREWLGDWDPERFDLEAMKKRISW